MCHWLSIKFSPKGNNIKDLKGIPRCLLFLLIFSSLESLFGALKRGGEHSFLYTLDWRPAYPLVGEVIRSGRARSFGRDAHGSVREEGDTRLASQISRINPGDQWGDRCCSQIALTSWFLPLLMLGVPWSCARQRLRQIDKMSIADDYTISL